MSRRFLLGACAVIAFVTGCGDGLSAELPPGNVRQFAGTGAVADQDAARQRILSQYLGLPAGRQEAGNDGPNGADVVGQGDSAPLSDVYVVPGGLLPVGTSVAPAAPGNEGVPWPLPEPHFLFWVDPMPGADLGHTCYILYLRASDGQILEQQVEFDPRVDDARPLEFDSARRANRLYRHELWVLSDDALGELYAPTPTRATHRGLAAGTTVRTVIIAGTSEERRQNDINAARDFAKNKLGQSDSDITVVQDKEDDRLTEDEVKQAIRTAASGLGEDDKLLVILSSHGSELSFTVGDGFFLWFSFGVFLAEEVKAEHVNLMLGPCHSGAAVGEIEESQSRSDSRVQILTSTDASHPAWAPGGVNVPLMLYYEGIGAALDSAGGDGTLTIDEIESAFGSVDLTADQCNQRYLKIYKDQQNFIGTAIEGLLGLFGSSWEDDFLQDDGEADDVRPHGDPVNRVLDGRPSVTPNAVREQEPNNSCATATPLDGNLAATGQISSQSDLDHYSYRLGPGAWKLSVNGGYGLYLEVDDGREPTTSFGSLSFDLSKSSKICAGVFGGLGSYQLDLSPR